MENKENNLQPEPELTAEEQLDLLLEKFLAEDSEAEPQAEAPIVDAPFVEGEADISEEIPSEEVSVEEAFPAEEEVSAEDSPILSEEELWEDQPVDLPSMAQEIGPDEFVVAAAGLTRPEDLEFEKIMEETLQEAALEEAEAAMSEEDDFSLPDEFFLPAEDVPSDAPVADDEPVYTEVDVAERLRQQQVDHMILETEEEPQEPEAEEAPAEDLTEEPTRKRRPKNGGTYGFFGIPHMIVTVIWLALILFIGIGLGNMIWDVAADMLALGRESQIVTITITADDDLDDIAQKLADVGLIENPGMFKIYAQLANAENKIKPGTYELNTIYDYNALVKNMASYTDRVSVDVMIPEGYTCQQIFRLLERNGVCTVEDMEAAVMNADLSEYWFLEGIDQSNPNCLEGFLFPDTYKFYLDHDPNSVLTKLLDNFDRRFSDAMIEKLDTLNATLADMMRSHGLSESYIQKNLFTIQELVIVASMIEKETSGDEESYYISSVIYNRLTNPGEYPYLNIDAALVYVTGRSPITAEDLKLDTPYNTYLYKGLIPGPISNPGLASLNAALSPENTEYYYYALDPSTGSHKFFKTYKAHQNFLESLKKGD